MFSDKASIGSNKTLPPSLHKAQSTHHRTGCTSTSCCQGSSIAGQPQCPRLWHSSTPNSRFLSHSPSAPPPPFTQPPYPPRSLVRDGQTHPHRPRLVVSHSTCPPLSSSPHAHSFVIGPAVIKHTHPMLTKFISCSEVAGVGRGRKRVRGQRRLEQCEWIRV